MIEQAVHKLLREHASIGESDIGVHYAERPEKFALPAVVVQRGSNVHKHTLKGSAGSVSGFVRVTVLDDDYLEAGDLKGKVQLVLDGFQGTVTVKTEQDEDLDVVVKFLKLEEDDDIPSDHRDGEGKIRTHGIDMDFRYSASEPIPTFS